MARSIRPQRDRRYALRSGSVNVNIEPPPALQAKRELERSDVIDRAGRDPAAVDAARQHLTDILADFLVDERVQRFGERKPGAVNAGAVELVQLKIDVIVAAGDPAIDAARRATSTIPIVMVAAGDPVQAGFVVSLARPGGNITGMTFLTRELAAKRLQILKEVVPTASRVAVLWNPDNPGGLVDFHATQAAATLLKLNLQPREVRTVPDFERAFQAMADERAQGIVVLTDPLTATRAGKPIAELAAKHRLPTMCELREFTDSGGLISYGPSLLAMTQRAARRSACGMRYSSRRRSRRGSWSARYRRR